MIPPDDREDLMLTVSRLVPAPPESVFRAWTDPSEIRRWWPPEGYTVPFADVDLRIGGEYRLGLQPPDAESFFAIGVYREIEPPRRLVFTLRWEPDSYQTGETLVTIELHERGEETEVVLTHERFRTSGARDRHQQGWTGCLERMGGAITAFHGPPTQSAEEAGAV